MNQLTSRVPFLDLPALHQSMREELTAVWNEVIGDAGFIGGQRVEAFEHDFAAYCGASSCIGVANGTDALELILVGLGIGAGAEVIVPANTFVATAEAVCNVGATPRFVDVDPRTLLIDATSVEAALTRRTAAIMAVHLYGQMADVDALLAITKQYGLALIEDAAQAHGATFNGRRAGSVGAAAAFSFYPGKNLGAFGDGGAVVTNDAALASRIRRLADHGRASDDRYRHDVSGRNSRLDSLQAGVLRCKLNQLDRNNAERQSAYERYALSLPPNAPLVEVDHRAKSVHHLAVVQVDDRAGVTNQLTAAGVGWGLHYPVPCHQQPAFARFATGPLPVVEASASRILSLPMSATLSRHDVDRVCDVMRRVVP
jgi:dTDP-4-amino-4,6-dideoxygalactose transaminase